MKRFYYDVLINEEDICNLKKERKRLLRGISKKEKMVVYGKRNTGKTSLVKNSIIPFFVRNNKNSFVLFVDLMQVKDMSSISNRIKIAFEDAFQKSFPAKSLFENIQQCVTGLRPVLSFDSLSGNPSVEFKTIGEDKQVHFEQIFKIINTDIATKMAVLIVIDEFQDIIFVKEAAALIRKSLQEFTNISVILMGSKKHLLSELFSKPMAPLADLGSDVEFKDISYEEYHEYIMERFSYNNLDISFEVAKILQDLLFRNPEPINIVGDYIVNNFRNKIITEKIIRDSILSIVEERQSRFEGFISNLTKNEEEVIIAVAKLGKVQSPTSKDFLKKVSSSHRTVMKIFKSLANNSMLEKNNDGYSIANPLLHYYINHYR